MTNITNQNEQPDGLLNFLEKRSVKPPKARVYDDDKTYALIYPRVSGLEQLNGYSLENQKKACEDYARKMGYEILGYFGCTNESAKTDERAALQEMLLFARKCKKRIIIITYTVDRFSRSGQGAVEIVNQLFKEGIYLQSATNPQPPGTLLGLIQTEKELMEAKHENQKRYMICNKGRVSRLLAGGRISIPPYAYYLEFPKGGRKREVYVDKEKAKVVKNIFEWYAYEKLTYAKISLRLQTLGIRLSIQAVGAMLKNAFYAGYICNKLLEGKVVKGKHEAIISEELFGIVNGYLGKNNGGYTHKLENPTVPLKGFCKCGICGYGLTGYDIEKAGKVYSYYKCQKNCQGVTITAAALHDLFLERLRAYEVNPVFRPLLKKQVVATFLQLSEKEFENEKVLRTQLTEAKKKLFKLKENLGQGIVPFDVYKEFEPAYKEKIALLEEELAKRSHDGSNLENQVQIAIDTACNLLNFWKLVDYRWKRQLQTMVFPSGIQYFKQNGAVLTPEINPVFSEIARVSKELENGGTKENSDILWNAFKSSEVLWGGLESIIDGMEGLKVSFPNVWGSIKKEQLNSLTGTTETVDYNYASDGTGFILSGTPYVCGDYSSTYAEVEVSLRGGEYSGATIFCSSKRPYVFSGLEKGSYTLAAFCEDSGSKYMCVAMIGLTGNTTYNPTLNPM